MPRTRASLLTSTGIYLSVALSRFDKAKRLLTTALDTYCKAGCVKSLEWAITLHHLGKVTRYLGDYAAAVRMLCDARVVLESVLPTPLDALTQELAELTLADTLHELGMHALPALLCCVLRCILPLSSHGVSRVGECAS
jgi:hypothetical protein